MLLVANLEKQCKKDENPGTLVLIGYLLSKSFSMNANMTEFIGKSQISFAMLCQLDKNRLSITRVKE